jgi:hypothetical protein
MTPCRYAPRVIFLLTFAFDRKRSALQLNKKTTPGMPGVVFFLLSG